MTLREKLMETLSKWSGLLATRWWGILAVYGSIALATYGSLWTWFDSQNVPSRISVSSSILDRANALLLASILAAAHVVLVLELVFRWRMDRRAATNSTTLQPKPKNPCPEYRDLLVERIEMRRGELTTNVFASRVLLAMQCGTIKEHQAREFMRECAFSFRTLPSGAYTLVDEDTTEAGQPGE